MKVDVLTETNHADRTVAACARGDYRTNSLVDVNLSVEEEYNDVISSVNHEKKDHEWAEGHVEDVTGIPKKSTGILEENLAKTRTFLRDLIRKGHYGPFEHPKITFAIDGVSRSCMAQFTRHRHASFDVQSMRYCNFEGADVIKPDSIKESRDRDGHYNGSIEESFKIYQALVDDGVPEEDARMVLPIGTKVHMTASMNLRSLMHVIDMRHAGDAQWEARELAKEMMEAAREVAPITISLYEEHAKGASKKAP